MKQYTIVNYEGQKLLFEVSLLPRFLEGEFENIRLLDILRLVYPKNPPEGMEIREGIELNCKKTIQLYFPKTNVTRSTFSTNTAAQTVIEMETDTDAILYMETL